MEVADESPSPHFTPPTCVVVYKYAHHFFADSFFFFGQVVLTLAIGATVLGGYMYYRFENTISFDYTGVKDEKKAAEALAGERGGVRPLIKSRE